MSTEMQISDDARSFHIEEWKSLRDEIAAAVRETRDVEKYVLVAAFAVWVWVIQAQKTSFLPALLLPPLAAILGAWRVRALGRVIGHAGAYLRKLECRLGDDRLGWERYFRGEATGRPMQHEVGRSITWFWVITLVGSCLISTAVMLLILKVPDAPNEAVITYTVRQ